MDLRKIKPGLRDDAKAYRKGLSEKEKSALDYVIFSRLLQEDALAKAEMIVTYVSTEIEVDTRALITWALKNNKRVVCPRCIPNTRQMDFIEIFSKNDLEKGTFSVLEPVYNKKRIIKSFSGSVCVVPGLMFDNAGYRLGYGKGYYDRFLAGYRGVKIGICYQNGIKQKLPHGRMDRTVDIILSENERIITKK